MITREFKLYLNAGVGVAPVINASQFDQGEEWVFTLLESDGTVYTPSTGSIIGLKSDGTTILDAGTVNSSGQVVITETVQMTAASGKNVYELLIDGDSHGTANFVVFVEPRPGDIEHPSETELSLFEETIQAAGNVQQFQADIAALQSGLATTNANLTSEANTRASADATLQSAISTEASTRSTQDAVLQAEIDQIIAPSGEAPSAAEVQNARIGVDGTTYDTLGNAIRGQVGDLKNALEKLYPYNLYAHGTFTNGFIKYSNGANIASTALVKTGYVNIEGITTLKYSRVKATNSTAQYGMAFYDTNQTFISSANTSALVGSTEAGMVLADIDVPEGAVYARFTCIPSYTDSFGVYDASQYSESTFTHVSEMDNELSKLMTNTNDVSLWEVGTIDVATGENNTATNRARTSFLSDNVKYVLPNEGYRFLVFAYKQNGDYVGLWNGTSFAKAVGTWLTEKTNLQALNFGNYKFKIVFSRTDNDDINLNKDCINIQLISFPFMQSEKPYSNTVLINGETEHSNYKLWIPSNYETRNGKAIPLVIGFHGNGSGNSSWTNSTSYPDRVMVRERCLSAGYGFLVVENKNSLYTWGNKDCVATYHEAITEVLKNFNFGKIGVFANSMGGIESLNFISEKNFLIDCFVGTSMTYNLQQIYEEGHYTSRITSAYGITTEYPYDVACLDKNPANKPLYSFGSFPCYIIGATDDVNIIQEYNGFAFYEKMKQFSDCTKVETTGGHSFDLSPFINDVMSFYENYFN